MGEPAMVLLPLGCVVGVPFYGIWDNASFDCYEHGQDVSCQQEYSCTCDQTMVSPLHDGSLLSRYGIRSIAISIKDRCLIKMRWNCRMDVAPLLCWQDGKMGAR